MIANGICPRYSDIDAYHMAACAIDEAVRNAIAVGAPLDRLAGLDNFCWCDPVRSEKTPDGEYKLAQLVRANQALYDITTAYGVPCISGKDSMKNDYQIGAVRISIPPTLLFSTLGKMEDVRKAVTMDVKRAGDLVYALGTTFPELGASEWYALHGADRKLGPAGPPRERQRRSMRRCTGRWRRGSSPPATTAPTGGSAWPSPRRPSPAVWGWRSTSGQCRRRGSPGTTKCFFRNRRAASS